MTYYYKEKEIKKLLKKHKKTWKDFNNFMYGQTVGKGKKGETLYYKCDVERFLEGGVQYIGLGSIW